jgi:hypothetical protein
MLGRERRSQQASFRPPGTKWLLLADGSFPSYYGSQVPSRSEATINLHRRSMNNAADLQKKCGIMEPKHPPQRFCLLLSSNSRSETAHLYPRRNLMSLLQMFRMLYFAPTSQALRPSVVGRDSGNRCDAGGAPQPARPPPGPGPGAEHSGKRPPAGLPRLLQAHGDSPKEQVSRSEMK